MEVRNPLDRENPILISHVICHGTRYRQGARRHDMTATETFATLGLSWLKNFDAVEILIVDQGTEIGADFQQLCQSSGILPVVTDFETLWQCLSSRDMEPCSRVLSRKRAVWKCRTQSTCGTRRLFARPTSFWTTTSTPVKLARSRPVVRRRRRPQSGDDSSPQSTSKTTAGTGGWRTRVHTQTEGWSPRVVWTWRMRLE